MNTRTMTSFNLLTIAMLVFCSPCAKAQRILELSSKTGVMFLSVDILNSSGEIVKKGEVRGRGYEWFEVPASGKEFKLKGLGVPTESVQLPAGGSTFVSVETKLATTYDISKESGLIMGNPEIKPQVQVGSTGFIFVGQLQGAEDDSKWFSIYLADDNGSRLDKIGGHQWTYQQFREIALKPGTVLTIDFPLNLRGESRGLGMVKGIMRPGQKVTVENVFRDETNSVYVKVTVKDP